MMTKFTFIVTPVHCIGSRPGSLQFRDGPSLTYTYTDCSGALTAWNVAGMAESHVRRLLRLGKEDQVAAQLSGVEVNADN